MKFEPVSKTVKPRQQDENSSSFSTNSDDNQEPKWENMGGETNPSIDRQGGLVQQGLIAIFGALDDQIEEPHGHHSQNAILSVAIELNCGCAKAWQDYDKNDGSHMNIK